MVAKLSGTSTFNLDLNEIIEEAFERCGAELRSGYDFRTARRSLNLLFMDWANRGINLWTLEQGSQVLTYNTGTYTLPVDTVDLLDHVIRTGTGTNQIDINITRISNSTYSMIPNKNATGRPIQVWINRLSGATSAAGAVIYPTFTVWPARQQHYLHVCVLAAASDAGRRGRREWSGYPVPSDARLGVWLVYYLSLKLPGAEVRTPSLKAMYDEDWERAADEDREKAAIRFVPRETFLR